MTPATMKIKPASVQSREVPMMTGQINPADDRASPLFVFERKVNCCGFVRTNPHALLLRSEGCGPGLNGVLARRNALDGKGPVGSRDIIERVGNDADVCLHPGMLIASNRDHDLRMRELLIEGSGTRRLRFVPLRIVLRHHVHIMSGEITIENLQSLADHNAEHVRHEDASLLVQNNGSFGGGKVRLSQSGLDEYKYIGKSSVGIDRAVLYVHFPSLVFPYALRVFIHVNFLKFWLGSFKKDLAGDLAGDSFGRLAR